MQVVQILITETRWTLWEFTTSTFSYVPGTYPPAHLWGMCLYKSL